MTNTYNIYFEMASVCVLVLMVILLKVKKQLNIKKNRLFYSAILLFLLLNMVDMFSAVMINRTMHGIGIYPIWLKYGVTMASYLIQQIMVQVFMVYIMVCFKQYRSKNVFFYALNILSVGYYGLVLSTPLTKIVFYFDVDGTYKYGLLHPIIYGLPLLFGTYALSRIIHHRRELPRQEFYMLMALGLSTIIVIAVQVIWFPNYLILYFWATLGLLAIFLTLQSPDCYLDQTTYAFNNDGLILMLQDRMKQKIPFSVLMMSVNDFEGIKDGFSPRNKRKVYQKICFAITHPSKKERKRYKEYKGCKIDVFRDDDKLYFMFHNPKDAEHLAVMIGGWVVDGIYLDETAPEVKLVSRMLLFDFPGRVQSEEEFYSVIKYFLADDIYKKYNVLQYINEEFFRKKKRYDDVRHLVEEAIRTEGIEMYYQPIYSTARRDFHSSEALVRLRDADSIGFVSPEEFIPIAEKEHLILQLEELILKKICSFIQKSRLQTFGVQYVEVNLSGNQCVQQDLAEQLYKMVCQYNIPPQFINFEVTETSKIDNSENLLRNMQQLQARGSTFSLDDYGSGSSNLEYLVDYPFEIVKLDKSIVWAHFGATNPKTRAVLPYSVHMLTEMNVSIVAEGVETLSQKEELERLGVHYLQGYYFSKPLPEREYLQFLRKYNTING